MSEITSEPPLTGVRVVHVGSHLGNYLAKLLMDLGADVVRVDILSVNPDQVSPFFRVGQRTACPERLEAELAGADLLITSGGPAELDRLGLTPGRLRERFPRLVHVALSPYGQDGPYADRPASDLTLLAAGGLLYLAGDPDRAPVRPVGEQSAIVTDLHAAVGALIALLVAEESGAGQLVDVSAQEAVTHSLENAAQYYDLEGVVRCRTGSTSAEAANGLFECADGWVYLVAGIGGSPLGWPGLVEWLEAEGVDGAAALRAERWQDQRWRRTAPAIAEFRELFQAFTRNRSKADLYEDGQRHGVSLAPVSTPEDLLANPQLRARRFFRTVQVDEEPVVVPGPPYRFDGMALGPR
ncbi:CoA transferase [Amycolatopsis deserti]|uniref:CoA transferase n=1 Tax=Amycolatopsis deserti TaxID=185696 RepID=A0ABQ3JFJ2_9PSEU|nr:CaiB/BaiF CoA-transferase family protein [Amycolatopsis deserti]GHF18749.1 CoA transferase [Amycolatopsis deserti]